MFLTTPIKIFPPKDCWTEHSQPLDKQHAASKKYGEDEEGEGAPLVQGGEGQGAKEVVCALGEASWPS